MKLEVFKYRWGLLQTAILVIPLASEKLTSSSVPFPPLGDDVRTWQVAATIVAGLFGVLAYIVRPRHRLRTLLVSMAPVVILALAAYFTYEVRSVVSIPLPTGEIRSVVKGDQRQSGLPEPYASMRDQDLIKYAGLHDEDLKAIYTPESLLIAKGRLFAAYIVFMASVEFILGSIARARQNS